METKNKKLTDEEFFRERKEVLDQWPTGKQVDLDEAIDFHKSLPPHKVWAKKMVDAKQNGDVLAITGMGKATIEQQLELLLYVQNEGQADLLGTSVDSMTRVRNYEAVEKGIMESRKSGKSMLNGLPVVNHGVEGIRKLIKAVDLPVQMRYGAADPRLIDEIGFAGGHTAGSGDGLYNFWNMNSKLPVETLLYNHQYVHRLVGYYADRGVPICLSCQGLYGSGVPHSLTMAALLTQMLMMAEQGTNNILLHFTAQGNLVQDVACANTLAKLSQEYLSRFGYKDVITTMTAGLSLVGYPTELGPAFAVICLNSIVAKLCGAQINDVRTVSEGVTIPTKEDIANTFRCCKVIIDLLKGQKIEVNNKTVKAEAKMAEAETRAILDKVIEMGDGDVAIGITWAIKAGVLDNPFATSPLVACKVMGVKDNDGALRYLDHGNLPFTKEIVQFHREKIAQREKKRGQEVDYETVVSDLLSIAKGILVE